MSNATVFQMRKMIRISQWGFTVWLYNLFNKIYDYVIYTAVIAKFGTVIGGLIMMAASFILDLTTLYIYYKSKPDIFGLEAIKQVRDGEPKTLIERITKRCLQKSRWIVFLVLSLTSNPFVVTVSLYHEQHYFSMENLGIQGFDTMFGKISVLVCYDQWFPEAARIAALQGAEILFYPSAIGHFVDEEPIEGEWKTPWMDIQRSHAIANNVYVAAINRVGVEDKLDFWGEFIRL